jgi:uncharacterized protein YutE (UPF0331/DUF86 family)
MSLQDVKNIIINKIASVEKCVARVKEEFTNEQQFLTNHTQQDACLLNLQRACEQSINIGKTILKYKNFKPHNSYKDVFVTLNLQKVISKETSTNMAKMSGFRNIMVHEYQELKIEIVLEIIKNRLQDFSNFNSEILYFINKESENQ